jgi:hypothetical protein
MTLSGVMAKFARADTHLNALRAEIPVFFDRDPYSFAECLDCEAGEYGLRIEIREPIPLMWSVIVGDYVHNLRSALDHLAWQLVLVSGGTPNARTAFPIFTSEPSNGRARTAWDAMTAGMHDAIIETLREVQPYARADRASEHGLAILAALSNADKHRLPVARFSAIAAHDPGSLGLLPLRGVEILDAKIATGIPLEDGDQFAWAKVRCTGPNPEIEVKGPLPMHVAFSAGTREVPMQGLVDVGQYAQQLMVLLTALCSKEGLI